MKVISWVDIFDKYKGLWVALKDDHKTVVASSKNPTVVYEEALKLGIKIPYLFKVPQESLPYVGSFLSVK